MDFHTENLVILSNKERARISELTQVTHKNLFSDPSEKFKGYPTGCCGVASRRLAEILIKSGYSNFEYVSAKESEVIDDSHAWLEYKGRIIDITAGQFDEFEGPIILSEDKSLHNKKWPIQDREPSSNFRT